MRQIRVLVVEDSLMFRELLVRNLNMDPAIEVVAAVRNPFEARDAIIKYQPDVMTLDIEMPKMNGIDFLKMLMPQQPMPVIVISSLSDKVFDALNAGAVDFVAKPATATREQLEAFMRNDLPVKIKVASIARLGSRKRATTGTTVPPVSKTTPQVASPMQIASKGRSDLVLAIGASTGGTEAIASVLKEFDTDIPGTVIVQHMPAGFTDMFAKRLNDQCRVRVKEAQSGDLVVPGQVLIAPGGDAHTRLVKVNGVYQVSVRQGERVSGHCPSVDVLFQSVADVAGKNAIGVILTGMGADGSKGMLAMRNAGARTIGQDESTCVVYGMPKVAFQIGAVEYQEKLPDIARRVYTTLGTM